MISPCYDEYRLFRCSDCDPENLEEGDPDFGEYERPYEIALPVDGTLVKGSSTDEAGPVDICPRCGSHLSMCSESVVRLERVRL